MTFSRLKLKSNNVYSPNFKDMLNMRNKFRFVMNSHLLLLKRASLSMTIRGKNQNVLVRS